VRGTLTAWLRAYGEANGLPGLTTGPIDSRFNRLRDHVGADEMITWTTPERRAAGGGPRIRISALRIDLECRFDHGNISVEKMVPVPPDAIEPMRERGSVGVAMRVERIELPARSENGDPLAQEIEGIFDRLTGNRWRGFVAPLREALEAEGREDTERAQRLKAAYERAEPRIGSRGQDNPFRLLGLSASAVAAFEPGEWLDVLNERDIGVATARLMNVDVGHGTMDIDARGADPPPRGSVRPRPRSRILAQKRSILEELESPQGKMPLLARLMASPAAMPIPRIAFPDQYLNAAVGRSRSQSRAVGIALGMAEGEAMLVEGPPGTGKSTTTGEIVAQLIRRDPQLRILVCSHSNHGTDNMLMKVVPYVEGTSHDRPKVPGLEIARVGMFERVPPDLRRFFVGPEEDLSDRNVVFTTIDALALSDAAGGAIYDYVVLDEANRATVLDSLVALARGRRFILVGDRLQLQPVLSEAEEQLRLEPAMARAGVIGKSLFVWMTERHFPDRAIVFLDEQNRMHPTIGGLIARAFYEDRLRNGAAAPRRDTGVPHFPHPAVWVDTRGLKGVRESRGRGPSLFNVPEARLVTTIARHILRDAPEGMDLGVIAAYAEQAALLRRMLRQEARANSRGMEIDTVDAFEGREKDVVIVSLVRSNRRREIGFLQLMQRINVALSRARRLLIVVGDTATLRGSYFDRILRYLRERGTITPGPRVIAQLRGAPVREERAERQPRRRRPVEAVAAPAASAATIETVDLEAEVAAEIARQNEGGEVRRSSRQRRTPAEILAALASRANGTSGSETDGTLGTEPAPGAEPTDSGSAPEAAREDAPAAVPEETIALTAPRAPVETEPGSLPAADVAPCEAVGPAVDAPASASPDFASGNARPPSRPRRVRSAPGRTLDPLPTENSVNGANAAISESRTPDAPGGDGAADAEPSVVVAAAPTAPKRSRAARTAGVVQPPLPIAAPESATPTGGPEAHPHTLGPAEAALAPAPPETTALAAPPRRVRRKPAAGD